MWADTQRLVEEFAGGYKLDRLSDLIYRWVDMVQGDERFTAFWSDVRRYANEALENPEIVLDEGRAQQLNGLIDRARELAQDVRYNDLTDQMLSEGRRLLDSLRSDPTTNKLIDDVRRLFRDLLFDQKGNLVFKPEELRQFKILLTSLILEELKYIPIPKLEGSTDTYDFCIQNAHFYGYDLLPDHIQVKWESNLDLNLRDVTADKARSTLTIKVTHIKTHMRNVLFWFRKKSGLIRMEDSGVCDVDLAGDGANIYIELEWDANREPSGFAAKRLSLDLDKLRVHVVDSRYDWLLNLLSPFISNDLKRSIEREVERRMRLLVDRAFLNLRFAARDITPALTKAADVAKRELIDLQRTKNALETA
jgi:hypothetical protein